jgi:hypothetical protein
MMAKAHKPNCLTRIAGILKGRAVFSIGCTLIRG